MNINWVIFKWSNLQFSSCSVALSIVLSPFISLIHPTTSIGFTSLLYEKQILAIYFEWKGYSLVFVTCNVHKIAQTWTNASVTSSEASQHLQVHSKSAPNRDYRAETAIFKNAPYKKNMSGILTAFHPVKVFMKQYSSFNCTHSTGGGKKKSSVAGLKRLWSTSYDSLLHSNSYKNRWHCQKSSW